MSRGISPQKAFLMKRIQAAIEREIAEGGLAGAELRVDDRNTFTVAFPAQVGPATEYTMTVREVMA